MKKQLFFLMLLIIFGQFLTAQSATGLHFDGQISNWDYIEVADDTSLDFTTAFTFETWVKFDTVTRHNDGWDWQCLFAKSRYNESYGLMLLTEGSKILRFYHAGYGSGTTDYIWTSTLSANTWYHIAVTLSTTKATIYINGNEVVSQNVSGSLVPNNNALRIGAGTTTGIDPYPLLGEMDEIRLWNYTRSETQINNSMNCQLAGNENGLVLNFDLNLGTVNGDNTSITTVTDKSTNGNNGTLSGFDLINTSGNFTDTATGNGISGTCSSLSTNEFAFQGSNITLVPNPSTEGSFTIKYNGNAKAKYLAIYNSIGRLVKKVSTNIFNNTISTSGLSKGLYLISINSDNDEVVKKLIIN